MIRLLDVGWSRLLGGSEAAGLIFSLISSFCFQLASLKLHQQMLDGQKLHSQPNQKDQKRNICVNS